jgi:molybdate transport system regulatory protein
MPGPKVTVSSAIRLETRLGGFANSRWMELLEAIDQHHSITAAAKAAHLSYKAAWDAIDTMNNLAGKPVVATAVGGKGGGGATLTRRGHELLATYRAVEAENERFLAELNARLRIAEPDLRALRRISMRTSARNQWVGSVARVVRGAVNDEVEVELAGGERIVSIITHESVENLGLEVGAEVVAMVKASSVMVASEGEQLRLSACNRLEGVIKRVATGAVNSEVVIELSGGNTVAAIVTNRAVEDLGLGAGQPALAVFQASSVVLGVS